MTDDKDQEIADLKARLAALEQRNAPAGPYSDLPTYHDPKAMPKRKANVRVGLWIIAALVLFVIVAAIAGQSGGSQGTTAVAVGAPANAAPSQDIATTGNVLNDALLRKSQADQLRILTRVVAAHCHGTRAFYDGIGHQGMFAGTAYWSVACRDGQSYMVSISLDDKDNKAVECSVMRAVAGVDCFTRF